MYDRRTIKICNFESPITRSLMPLIRVDFVGLMGSYFVYTRRPTLTVAVADLPSRVQQFVITMG